MGRLTAELEKVERRMIKEALHRKKMDAAGAAKYLGISLDDLLERARRLGIALVVVRRKTRQQQKEGNGRGPATGLLNDAVHELEKRWMLEALEQTAGNSSAAAALINMPRSLFARRLREFGIEVARGSFDEKGAPQQKRRDLPAAVEQLKREYIAAALADSGGDLSAAANKLGISRSTLYRLRTTAPELFSDE